MDWRDKVYPQYISYFVFYTENDNGGDACLVW